MERAHQLPLRMPIGTPRQKKQRHRKSKLFRIDFAGDEGGCEVVHLLRLNHVSCDESVEWTGNPFSQLGSSEAGSGESSALTGQ